jgi:alkanesulfonate monooxygenase SsuD/methylene tetrahydromethanopterin reductase-like flavin-dependent oxidoreductase (luciferase family)
VPFRQAHHRVGELVTTAARNGTSLDAVIRNRLSLGMTADDARTTPSAIAAAGPPPYAAAAASLQRVLDALRSAWMDAARRLAGRSRQWREARLAMASAVRGVQSTWR